MIGSCRKTHRHLRVAICTIFVLFSGRGAHAGVQVTKQQFLASPADPYSRVDATIMGVESNSNDGLGRGVSRYIIGSFPHLRQVGYVRLPDIVWRPLVIHDMESPRGIAVDPQNYRLFVSDAPRQVIWSFQLRQRNGFLETSSDRHAAVEGFAANWLAVNNVGDLYFSGHKPDQHPEYDSIFRQSAVNLATGNSLGVVEVYQRANTGDSRAKAWSPSGLAVDSFFIYWGNKEQGKDHGSVVKGSRMNIGFNDQDTALLEMNDAVEEVRGITMTGTHVFFASPSGVYGMSKGNPNTISDPNEGLLCTFASENSSRSSWNPSGITWDGESTLYVVDSANGVLHKLPSFNAKPHNATKFADAPGIDGIAAISFNSAGVTARSRLGLLLLSISAVMSLIWAITLEAS